MRFSSALVRSTVLALVSAALTTLVMLAVGAVVFAVRVQLGRVPAQAGFEPNYFLRTVGLPAAAAVFVIVLVGSTVMLRRS
ncbi:MAG: hypothetical protein JO187_03160 [Acidobacteria bacterium]|nr:hypothetical protein [Acidobacteriaceae bacterium]MBV9608534.1 hypothetical protein [Acidobacteriota bacterium]